MKDKSFAVIGLGQFGMTLAATLAESNCDVLVIDDKEENIQEIAEKVTYAVKADVREPGILKNLGVQDVDVAVIAVSENIEASISATMQAKDLGVPYVMSKAMNSLHGRILSKIGADEVIYPEKSMGLRVAKNLMAGGFLDIFELSSEISLAEFRIPTDWAGKSLSALGVREKHKINIIGIKINGEVRVDLNPDEKLPEDCTLIAVGKNRDLDGNPAFRNK